jgi:transposase
MMNAPPIPAELWDKIPPEARAALLVVLSGYEARVRALEARVAELERRLGQNSSNSSTPPSADPPGAPSPVAKKPTGRRTGGQPGHKGHSRQRLPEDRVDHVIPLVPDRCERCRAPLPEEAVPADPEPTWHQVAELPPVLAVVTEFRGHARTCPCCGHVTRAAIPAEVAADAFGPRLAAALSYLAGCQHVSQRGLEALALDLFGVPLSLGAVNRLQDQVCAALQAPHREAAAEVRAAAVKNVDETSWKLGKRLRWLWLATTRRASYFLIQPGRGRDQLEALLGREPPGVIGSDRFSAYGGLPLGQRQLCWAHLKRDFQAMAERGGQAGRVGEGLLAEVGRLFDGWHRYRGGGWTWGRLRHLVFQRVRPAVEGWLIEGAGCGCEKAERTCVNLLGDGPALWTFARVAGVEPTNNAAERALRPAVLRRKRSYGSQSEGGCRFGERLLTVIQTLRQGGRAVLDYLADTLNAHRHGLPALPLLSPT